MTYDQKCWDLADVFLSDVTSSTAQDRHDLAQEIQRTIEDFCADLEAPSDHAVSAVGEAK